VRAGAASKGRLAEALAQALAEAVAAIRALPGPTAGCGADPAALGRAAEVLDRLEDLLAASDFGANALYGESAALLAAALDGAAEEIGRLIGRYEYALALDRLRAARAGASGRRT
jgi:hypothetical protein